MDISPMKYGEGHRYEEPSPTFTEFSNGFRREFDREKYNITPNKKAYIQEIVEELIPEFNFNEDTMRTILKSYGYDKIDELTREELVSSYDGFFSGLSGLLENRRSRKIEELSSVLEKLTALSGKRIKQDRDNKIRRISTALKVRRTLEDKVIDL